VCCSAIYINIYTHTHTHKGINYSVAKSKPAKQVCRRSTRHTDLSRQPTSSWAAGGTHFLVFILPKARLVGKKKHTTYISKSFYIPFIYICAYCGVMLCWVLEKSTRWNAVTLQISHKERRDAFKISDFNLSRLSLIINYTRQSSWKANIH
jgi:hypothetical protein